MKLFLYVKLKDFSKVDSNQTQNSTKIQIENPVILQCILIMNV